MLKIRRPLGRFIFNMGIAIPGKTVFLIETAPSKLNGDWKDIFITHLIIIIKSEVSTFPIVVIFFCGFVSEMVVLSYSVIYYIYIPGTLGPCFHYWCSVYSICKWSDTLVMFVCLQITPSHYHHYADLSEGIELLKCLVRYMLPSVCLRLRQFFQSSFVQYMGLCIFNLPNSPAMIVRMCTSSYYHHQIGTMNH